MIDTKRTTTLSRRNVIGALGCAGVLPLVTHAQAQQLFRTDLLDKKRAYARGRFDSAASKSKRKDAAVEALLATIERDRLAATIKELATFPTRWTLSPDISRPRDWVAKQFNDLGYPVARVRQVEARLPNGMLFHNVLCAPERLDQGFILICGHYDCTSENASVLAPGADDNASGIAAILETARIFSKVPLKRGVMFAAFAGEEQGLVGSQAVANIAAQERWAIDVVINLDMVGHVDPARPTSIVVEYDQGNVSSTNDAAAKAFGLQMAQYAADYTSMTVEHTDIWNSDYMPFEAKGYPCIGLYDGAADAPFYHSTRDKPEQVDLGRLVEITGLISAFVANVAEFRSS
jgi:hypothetical protein